MSGGGDGGRHSTAQHSTHRPLPNTATAAGTKQAAFGPNPSYPESNFESFETCPPDEVKPDRISHQAAVTPDPGKRNFPAAWNEMLFARIFAS